MKPSYFTIFLQFAVYYISLSLPFQNFIEFRRTQARISLTEIRLFNWFNNVESNARTIDDIKAKLLLQVSLTKPNGMGASKATKEAISDLVNELEKLNPTSNPAYSSKMNGFWRLEYTDFSPPAPSSGKLGPFVGDVYQDLDGKAGIIKNLLKISFPPIIGGLIAKQRIKNRNTWFDLCI